MDYPVSPLFLAQAFAFLLLFFPRDKKILGLFPKTWILMILFFICVGLLFSLIHDSTDVLPLYF